MNNNPKTHRIKLQNKTFLVFITILFFLHFLTWYFLVKRIYIAIQILVP